MDHFGRAIVVVSSPTIIELPVGLRFVVLGNDLPTAAVGFGWLGKRAGRPPLPAERANGSYCAPVRRRAPEPDDDALEPPEAIELARLEQQRTPADLISAVLSR